MDRFLSIIQLGLTIFLCIGFYVRYSQGLPPEWSSFWIGWGFLAYFEIKEAWKKG